MQERRPMGTGAVLLAGDERRDPTKTRPVIQANATMALRLEALKFGRWWAR